MLLRSPRNLHYPITVTSLLVSPSSSVSTSDPLFAYFYKTKVTEGNRYGEEFEVEKTFPTRFESETDGVLLRWKIEEGCVILGPDVELVEIEEPCRHDVHFGGLCVSCGKDMTEVGYNTSKPDTMRANINMAHGNTALRVSQEEAARVEQEAKRRLLKSKTLSLVVDLDQTIIHATVDPTVAEWQRDMNNPNHDAVKDVRSFQLLDDGPGRGCWYYIKLRPGLAEFLENVSKVYELHIYTMGTRAYAMKIAKIVDPDRKIFGDRILSRDESGSLTAKNLQRLFPVDTNMVVIIDDRGDVWNWSDNLIKVKPYDFFVGIGDINSSFLPRRDEMNTSQDAPAPSPHPPTSPETFESFAKIETKQHEENSSSTHTNGSSTIGDVSALSQLVSMGGANDPASMKEKTTQQDETLASQLADRPLLQKQKALDEADEEAEAQVAKSEQNGDELHLINAVSPKSRHNLLHDDDRELYYLERALRDVHRNFYEAYERTQAGSRGGRIAQLRDERSPKKLRPDESVKEVPDVKEIMPRMKRKVLNKAVLTFSGVVPLGTHIRNSDVGRWATSFGASIETDVHRHTTHVIAARNRRTAKVRVAARNPRIKIVTLQWLSESISRWKAVDETPYLIEVEPDNQPSNANSVSPFDFADGTLSSSEEEANHDVGTEGRSSLRLDVGAGEDEDDANQDEEDDANPISPADDVTQADWDSMLAEIQDLSDTEDGGDASGDDSQSDASQESMRSRKSTSTKKRKRAGTTASEDVSEEVSEAEANGDGSEAVKAGSRLEKRKKTAFSRTTSLTKMATLRDVGAIGVAAPDSHLADTPKAPDGDGNGDKEDVKGEGKGEEGPSGDNDAENYDDDDGFDALFHAELEAQLNADPEVVGAENGKD